MFKLRSNEKVRGFGGSNGDLNPATKWWITILVLLKWEFSIEQHKSDISYLKDYMNFED